MKALIPTQSTVKLVILKTPPSVNNYVRHIRAGFHYKTSEAKVFETYVALAWKEAEFTPPKAKLYGISIMLYMGHGQRLDIDNAPKVLIDSLVKVGAIKSDALVNHLVIEKCRDRERPRVEVEIEYK